MRLERRADTPVWLRLGAPLGGVVAAAVLISVILIATGQSIPNTYGSLFSAGFLEPDALSTSLLTATPIVLTGLSAAVAFRTRLFNIGQEGQLYVGALGAVGVGLVLGKQAGVVVIPAMAVAGAVAGAGWALVPGLLRAYLRTNEILTTLMLNYVAGLLITYLIFNSNSYWRALSGPLAKSYPIGKSLTPAGWWPAWSVGGVAIPSGLILGLVVAVALLTATRYTHVGFQWRVIGDSPAAATYAGMRTSRLVLGILVLSGALAGLGGAAQVGNLSHTLDPIGLQQAAYGYTGIVVAALAAFDPVVVVVYAIFLGAITSAATQLEGPSFPVGMVGVIEGVIVFCVIAATLFTVFRVTRGKSSVHHHTPNEPRTDLVDRP